MSLQQRWDTALNRLYCGSVIVASNTAARLPKRIAAVQRAQPNAWPPAWTKFLAGLSASRASIGWLTLADIAAPELESFDEASHDPPSPSGAVLIGSVSACCGRTPDGPSRNVFAITIQPSVATLLAVPKVERVREFVAFSTTLERITNT
jgi:hypothetical protein